MIRDLEEEVVAIRNLVESCSYTLLTFMRALENSRVCTPNLSDDLIDPIDILQKAQQKYHQHSCDRFEKEVKEADKVLEKNMRCHGYEYHEGYAFVPGNWLFKSRKFTDRLLGMLEKRGFNKKELVQATHDFKYSWEKEDQETKEKK